MSALKNLSHLANLPGDLKAALGEVDARLETLEAFAKRARPLLELFEDAERARKEDEAERIQQRANRLPHAGGDKPKG